MELEPLLRQLQTPNTQVIKAAEDRLKVLLKQHDSVRQLMEVVGGSPDEFARHIGAILLRRRLRGHWTRHLQPAERAAVRTGVLQLLGGEPARLVRNSIASVVAEVARLEMGADPPGQWPELFGVISTCASAPNDAQRECAYVLLLELAPAVGDTLMPHHETLLQMFAAALGDGNERVRTAAMHAVSAFLRYLARSMALEAADDDSEGGGEAQVAMRFASLMPPLLNVASQCLVAGNETEVCEVLDIFGDLVATPLPLVNHQIGVLVPFLLDVLRADSFELTTRDAAALVLNGLADWRPKLLGRSGFVPQIMEVLAWLIASSHGSVAGNIFSRPPVESGAQDVGDSDSDDGSKDGEEDGRTEQGMAQSLLDQLALNVPTTYLLEPTMAMVQQCLGNEDPGPNGAAQRKAGACMLAVVCEGCQEYLRGQLPALLPLVVRAARDSVPEVKEAACFCLGQMAEHLTPEVLGYAAEILPSAMEALAAPVHNVQCVACYLLEQYCERLQPPDVRPFLEHLMVHLMGMLQTGRPDLQEKCISAISALAMAAEDEFIPFLPGATAPLLNLLNVTDDVFKRLRGGALESLGHMSIAVGPDAFEPYLEPCMRSCSQNLTLGDTELTEYTFCFLANLIKAFGTRLSHFLPQLVPSLCGTVKDASSASFDMTSVADQYTELVEDDEEEPDGELIFNVHTGVVDMQKAGLAALGAAVGCTEGACVDYTADVLEAVASCLTCWTDQIRSSASGLLAPTIACSMAANPPARAWRQGEHTTGDFALAEHTREVVRVAVELMTGALEEDTEREAVGAAVMALHHIMDLVGPFALCVQTEAGWVINDGIMTHILKLLEGKAPCQTLADEDAGMNNDAGDADHDAVLMDAVADAVGECAKVLGASFCPYLDVMLPPLLVFTEPQRPRADRSMAVGAVAELFQHLGPAAAVYTERLLPVVRSGIHDPAFQVRRNATFALGALVDAASGGQFRAGAGGLESQFPLWLEDLRPIFAEATNADVDGALLDNAASAVCRMVTAAPDALPLGRVLDELVLPVLPLKDDPQEAMAVYGCLCNLLLMGHGELQEPARLSRVLSVLAAALRQDALGTDEVKMQVVQSLSHALPSLGDTAERAMHGMPEDLRGILASAMASLQG